MNLLRDPAADTIGAESIELLPRRERSKEDRRHRILVAAETLIRETGSTGFPMAQLAERAGVSGPTPYNLFGTKSGILYALLNRALDPMIWQRKHARVEADPIAHVLDAGRIAAEVFAADPLFYKPLYRFLVGEVDAVHRPQFLQRSFQYWHDALAVVPVEAGMPSHDLVARLLVTSFQGTLDQWVGGELDEDGLRNQIAYGTGLLVFGLASAASRAGLQLRLKQLEQKLSGRFVSGGGVTALM